MCRERSEAAYRNESILCISEESDESKTWPCFCSPAIFGETTSISEILRLRLRVRILVCAYDVCCSQVNKRRCCL